MESVTTEFASHPSSSTTHQSWTHDVFLSFRGDDVRNNFVSHLHSNLVRKGFKTFLDDDGLRGGEDISSGLHKAIQESKASIVVFSENYAFSKWCLEELVKILECKESKRQMVYPVFYKVDPSDVRHQKGSFGKALADHECKFKDQLEKVVRWREAVTKAANLSGMHFSDGRNESKCIDAILEEVSAQLLHGTYLYVAKYPVGIESRAEDVLKLLNIGGNGVRMVGIWGVGGIGKTTLAKAVYNSVAHQFEGSCFLANVREESMTSGGFVRLQNMIFSDILRRKVSYITTVDQGITMIKETMSNKRVLLILDDVNHLNQLNNLIGNPNWFGSGSRIIITTRDKHCLTGYNVSEIYKADDDGVIIHQVDNSDQALKALMPEDDDGSVDAASGSVSGSEADDDGVIIHQVDNSDQALKALMPEDDDGSVDAASGSVSGSEDADSGSGDDDGIMP